MSEFVARDRDGDTFAVGTVSDYVREVYNALLAVDGCVYLTRGQVEELRDYLNGVLDAEAV